MSAAVQECEPVSVSFEQSLRDRLADYECHRCCECKFVRAIYEVLDKVNAMPIADGCYNEHQLACVRELLEPSVADTLDGIPATVYVVHSDQPACWDFVKRRR